MQFSVVNGSPYRMGWKGAKKMLGDGPIPFLKVDIGPVGLEEGSAQGI